MRFDIRVPVETLVNMGLLTPCPEYPDGMSGHEYHLLCCEYDAQFDQDNLLKLWVSIPLFIMGQDYPKYIWKHDDADVIVFEFN